MGIRCGSQVLLCEYPVSLDTYRNCTHACKYCFAQSKASFIDPEPMRCVGSLRNFIAGKRTSTTNWCDFPIPLHWGGMSDPFQPAEAQHKASLECLKVLAEAGYPFIVSTKGRLVAEEPYISLLEKCNAVVQISMVCPDYDKLEPGAPTFAERIEMARRLSGRVRRVIARAQPYIVTARKSLVESIPAMAEAGIYGLTVEGMKFKRKKPGTVKVRGDWCYPQERLKQDYITIRDACRENGMAFFCAENRLRSMGDSTSCCGCGDLEGFEGNKYNLVSIAAGGGGAQKPTPAMTLPGTADCFKAVYQEPLPNRAVAQRSFAEQMALEARRLGFVRPRQ